MTTQVERLRQYNRWRRGDDNLPQPDPKELGELLDGVADRLEVLEREHQEFFERWHGERRKREALQCAVENLVAQKGRHNTEIAFLDSFSGDLADLKRGKRTTENALAVLDRNPMVSTWDMSENKWLYRLICDLKYSGLIVEQEQPYPWHRYGLTDAGKAHLPSNAGNERTAD